MNNRSRLRWLVWFAALNGLVATVIAFVNVPVDAMASLGGPGAFIFLALPVHFFVLVLLIALVLSPLLILGRLEKATLIFVATVYGAFLTLVFTDARVFALYRFHLNGMVWNLMTGGAVQEILEFTPALWLRIISIVVLFLGAEIALALVSFNWQRAELMPKARYFLLGLGLVTMGVQLAHAWSDASGYSPVTSQTRYIPWAALLKVRGFLRSHGFTVAQHEHGAFSAVRSGTLDYPKEKLTCSGQWRPNIVLLLVESLRSDMLKQEVMPHSWAFSKKSLNFADHYSTGNATRFGVFGLMYGLPGSYWHAMLAAQTGSEFINELARQGYDFYIQGSAPLTSPEFDRTVFSTIRDRLKPHAGTDADAALVAGFVEFLERHELRQPFFAFLFLNAPHAFSRPKDAPAPFQPESESVNYLELHNGFDPTPLLNRYKNSVHYDDLLISRVVGAMEAKALLDNTVVVLTGDHGKEFNELKQNYWGHNSNFSVYQVKVPLVVHWPGRGFAEYAHRTSHMDIVPTLMSKALGCSNPVGAYSTGIDLFAGQEDRFIPVDSWSHRAIVGPEQTTVLSAYGDIEVYDKNYVQIANAQPDKTALLKNLEMAGNFFRR